MAQPSDRDLIAGFPIAIHLTLTADTQYWRGLGRQHKDPGKTSLCSRMMLSLLGASGLARHVGGLRGGRASDADVAYHRWAEAQPLVPDAPADALQRIIERNRQRMLDFAYLALGPYLDRGSMAAVFRGTYRGRAVAVKVFTPPEITIDQVSRVGLGPSALHPCTLAHPPVMVAARCCSNGPERS